MLEEQVVSSEDDSNQGSSAAVLPDDLDDNSLSASGDCCSAEQLKRSNALWILKIGETRSLSRGAVTGIVQDTSDLILGIMGELERKVHRVMSTNGLDPAIFSDVFHYGNPYMAPFEGLKTFHQQLRYYRNNFNLVVSVTDHGGLMYNFIEQLHVM